MGAKSFSQYIKPEYSRRRLNTLDHFDSTILLRRLRNCKHVAFEDDEGSSCPEGEAQAPLHQS